MTHSHAHHLTQTSAELHALAARLSGEPSVVLDTEFVWERTFYPILGLVQVAVNDGTCWLIDTVAVPDLSPLAPVLTDLKIEKVLHDAPQDLMILNRAAGVAARHIFDTRVAAGFAGLDSTTSLQNLLANLLDVHLPKGHTRTDWTARPLSVHQLEYAVDDVIHMPAVVRLLRERARQAGTEAWMDAEMAALYDAADYAERAPEESYLRIRPASYLPPRNLAVMRELAAWRERQAREADLPRSFVVADHELMSVAQVLPLQAADLAACRDLHPHVAKRYAAPLLEAVRKGLAVPETQWPAAIVKADERQAGGKEKVRAALDRIRVKAQALNLDPQLVASKGEVIQLLAEGAAAEPARHRLLRGWRAELLGRDWLV